MALPEKTLKLSLVLTIIIFSIVFAVAEIVLLAKRDSVCLEWANIIPAWAWWLVLLASVVIWFWLCLLIPVVFWKEPRPHSSQARRPGGNTQK